MVSGRISTIKKSVEVSEYQELRALIAKQPGNANLHLKLAVYLSCRQTPSFFDLGKEFDKNSIINWNRLNGIPVKPDNEQKDEFDFFSLINSIRIKRYPVNPKARAELTTAIALGLDDYMLSAKARLLLARITLGELSEIIQEENKSNTYLERRALIDNYNGTVKVFCNDVLKDIKGLLRRKPYDIEGLNIQKALYRTLKNKEGYLRTEMRLQEALALKKLTGAAEGKGNLSTTPISKSRKNTGIGLEELTKTLLASMGLKATTTKTTADGGIDLIAYSENAIFSGKYVVQCKDWNAPVGEPVIRDLYGVVMSEGANKGIVITTGSFTPAARKFAEGKQIELIDGDELKRLQQKYLYK